MTEGDRDRDKGRKRKKENVRKLSNFNPLCRCSKRGLDLLLIDDETQNNRVTTLLKEHGVHQV